MRNRDNLIRCRWVDLEKPEYVAYHDLEWGIPVHDDRLLFEFLVLEGAQAGLSWLTVLRKRENYRRGRSKKVPRLSIITVLPLAGARTRPG